VSDEAVLFWATLAVMLVVAALLLLLWERERRIRKESNARFRELFGRHANLSAMSQNTAEGRVDSLFAKLFANDELARDLRRAGLATSSGMHLMKLASFLVPLLGAALGVGLGLVREMQGHQLWAAGFAGFVLGYLTPPRVVGVLAARRQKRIREEMVPMLHMLRMLFDAGLSLEQTLRILHQEGGELIPEIAAELRIAVTRIAAGEDRADALQQMAEPLGVLELNDAVAVLKQATRYGGSLRESLARFAELIEERRMSGLREYVSKLSAKMTIVMILFMFPALLIFIAGPGMVTVMRALSEMG
jgi:tight adherence protein C